MKKEINLGFFYGQSVILKVDEFGSMLEDKEWQTRWSNYMIFLKKEAVDAYQEEELLKEMESYKPSKMKIFIKLLKKLVFNK